MSEDNDTRTAADKWLDEHPETLARIKAGNTAHPDDVEI